jgi:hypothetical protein
VPSARIKVAAPLKQIPGVDWTAVDPVDYPVQSCNFTQSWGAEPAQANIVYLSANAIQAGSAIQLTVGPYFFSGICRRDAPLVSSRGNTRQLTFEDYRLWLAYDKVYAAFNRRDDMLVGGQRLKRYQHILPVYHATRRKTWGQYNGSQEPYTAAQILALVLAGPGIGTPWSMARINKEDNLANGRSAEAVVDGFHSAMNYPIYDLDFERGKSLADLMLDICEATGLLFTLMPTATNPFRIVWAMKGVDGPDISSIDLTDSDDRESALELSGFPTRVRILGDRNLYQVHDIGLVPDWNRNWDQSTDYPLYTVDLLVDFIYRNGTYKRTGGFVTNYWDIPDDFEHIIGWQKAVARAKEITVWEFHEAFSSLTGGLNFRDDHKYQGHCRNDMPAALYIQNLLFRAFRLPSDFWFINTYGERVYLPSLDVADKLLGGVTHDPVTGATSWDMDDNQDGNCYVIVQGYQFGKDLFESIRPDRFNLTDFNDLQNVWQKIEAQVQNNNDAQGPTIMFDEPVIRSSDLVTMIDNFARINAVPTITVPNVRAVLTFEAENFSWYQTLVLDPAAPPADPIMGTQVNDDVLSIQGLGGEFIRSGGVNHEVPYATGKFVRTLAIEYANTFLRRQQIHASGSFGKLFFDEDPAYQLHGKVDRISIDHSPSGSNVKVYLTNERAREFYQPERDLDRMRQWDQLLPGEGQLRKDAQTARKIAIVARSDKDAAKTMMDAYRGEPHARTELTTVRGS